MSRILKANTFQMVQNPKSLPEKGEPDQRKAILDAAQITAGAKQRAQSIIEKAEEERKEILFQAQEEAQRMREEAYQQGFEQGRIEARAAFEEELNQRLAKLDGILQEAVQVRRRAMEMAEEDLLKLSLAIAEKIIRREVDKEPPVINEIVGQALQLLGGAEKIFIYVNDRDLTFLEGDKEELASGHRSFVFAVDNSISPGGCIIETDIGRIDARLETRLERVSKELLENLGG
ncbi:MAG: FliH/SctL family protein [Limnochordia bacterium]